jgi:hypothetical protein
MEHTFNCTAYDDKGNTAQYTVTCLPTLKSDKRRKMADKLLSSWVRVVYYVDGNTAKRGEFYK